jgi:hypothetical protein
MMISQGWFQKDKPAPKRPRLIGAPALARVTEATRLAAKLRPHELIAMLTHHYSRVRARSLPRVTVTIAVRNPAGKQAVTIAC